MHKRPLGSLQHSPIPQLDLVKFTNKNMTDLGRWKGRVRQPFTFTTE